MPIVGDFVGSLARVVAWLEPHNVSILAFEEQIELCICQPANVQRALLQGGYSSLIA